MKYLAYLYKIIAISLSLFILVPSIAYADNVSVDSHTNGQSTTCVNGNCTTTGGGSSSTVCVNGQCTTTNDGNVDYSSPDGHNQVHIHNNTGGNSDSVSITPEPTAGSANVSPSPIVTLVPSLTPDPTITQMRNDINKHVKQEIEGVKEHIKNQNAAISDFFKSLESMLGDMFK